jgi:hypothetical protein
MPLAVVTRGLNAGQDVAAGTGQRVKLAAGLGGLPEPSATAGHHQHGDDAEDQLQRYAARRCRAAPIDVARARLRRLRFGAIAFSGFGHGISDG